MKAWALYRPGAALKTLLQSLGWWAYLSHTVSIGVAIGTGLVSQYSLPARIIVGLACGAMVLFVIGFSIAIYRVGEPRAEGSQRPSAEVSALVSQIAELKDENRKLKEDNQNLSDPIGAVGRRVNSVVDEIAIKDAPRLLLEYKTEGGRNLLTLINDGDDAIYRWNLRPLVISYSKIVASHHGNPSIQGKQKLPVEVSIGSENHTLLHTLREEIPLHAGHRQAMLEVYYEDAKGASYLRAFEAIVYPEGSLLLQPGAITLLPTQRV